MLFISEEADKTNFRIYFYAKIKDIIAHLSKKKKKTTKSLSLSPPYYNMHNSKINIFPQTSSLAISQAR